MGDLRLAVVVIAEHIRDSFHVFCSQCALLHVEDQRRLRGELQNLGPFLLCLLQDVLVIDDHALQEIFSAWHILRD